MEDKEFAVDLKREDYKKGYLSGFNYERFHTPPNTDGLSFSSGYIEGKADRGKGKESKYSEKT
ncbi:MULTISPECIES: hypothetical protein [unclassified Oceanispirochaeta]|uniref:hypothetical protein n=1 Tax=unclassified Oceanispirochaeta TaxID=2635722 RepID=UPI000E092DB9|nr:MULTISPECIES: hypothetical protein [unclassified Oceanispirochaeta]MBF9018962.1 hypothetical protein [Oceanispirochaeta sp. M2]NPD75446.1 hypothetical protein [Oceanispirochaeta sp. M1]RDG28696.1 hypothetical protein DV872_25465 [Oceanispirochaeta sp. M1]